MKKRTRRNLGLCVVTALMCVCLSSCLNIIGSIIDNIGDLYSFVKGFGVETLPTDVVYGSTNSLAVGFDNQALIAFWDTEPGVDYTVKVMSESNDISTLYAYEQYKDLYGEGIFYLERADYDYTDAIVVTLMKTDNAEKATSVSVRYGGLDATTYNKYTRPVSGGFTDIDYYAASRYELFELFQYLLLFRPNVRNQAHDGESSFVFETEIYFGYDFERIYQDKSREVAFGNEIVSASASFEDSAAYSYSYNLTDSVGKLYFKFIYDVYPKLTTESSSIYQNALTKYDKAHYSLNTHTRSFAIDSVSRTVTVSSSDQLYFALKKGYRPSPVKGSNAHYLYAEMRRILAEINSNITPDPVKIHSIYDYIVDTAVYDYTFVDRTIKDTTVSDDRLFLYKCLYMEGVFGLTDAMTFDPTARAAICDGLSKAFLCMATIEGIETLKVSGTAQGGDHAWNKVNVDGKWYMVDVTWGNALDSVSRKEYLSHAYLMTADDNKHTENKWFGYPSAKKSYVFLYS